MQIAQITSDEAAFVYARACRSWYGGGARRMIMAQIEQLRRGDDPEALRICRLIASELSKLEAERGTASAPAISAIR